MLELVAADVHTGDGWFGVVLAVLNVVQTVALAFLAGYAARRRGAGETKSAASLELPSGTVFTVKGSEATKPGESGE